ncbi:hypothetical protein Tco_0713502 [Tanacetum coccineum]
MKECIRLEEEKARRRGKVYNWETATYGKIWLKWTTPILLWKSISGLRNKRLENVVRCLTWKPLDKEYVDVKEDEYDDLERTSEDACRAYQEIFCMMDEG